MQRQMECSSPGCRQCQLMTHSARSDRCRTHVKSLKTRSIISGARELGARRQQRIKVVQCCTGPWHRRQAASPSLAKWSLTNSDKQKGIHPSRAHILWARQDSSPTHITLRKSFILCKCLDSSVGLPLLFPEPCLARTGPVHHNYLGVAGFVPGSAPAAPPWSRPRLSWGGCAARAACVVFV